MAAAYPASSDIITFLAAAGVTAGSAQATQAAAAVSAEFERTTGRMPFLAGSASARVFDPPTGPGLVLDLRDDLATLTSLTINGVSQVEGTDFWLEPYNAASKGIPYNRVRFSQYKWSMTWAVQLPQFKQSISVSGRWGFSTTVPEDVWYGLLQGAALYCQGIIFNASTGGFTRISIGQGDEDVSIGKDLAPQLAKWQMGYQSILSGYGRNF